MSRKAKTAPAIPVTAGSMMEIIMTSCSAQGRLRDSLTIEATANTKPSKVAPAIFLIRELPLEHQPRK